MNDEFSHLYTYVLFIDGPADLLPPGMLQASMMMGNLGAPPGDLVFSQAVMSAYNSDPLADLVTNDDQVRVLNTF